MTLQAGAEEGDTIRLDEGDEGAERLRDLEERLATAEARASASEEQLM